MPKKKVSSQYKITLEVNNEKFSSYGDTLEQALLSLKQINPKTKGFLSVEKDGNTSKQLPLVIRQMNRLFYPGVTGQIQRAAIIKRIIV